MRGSGALWFTPLVHPLAASPALQQKLDVKWIHGAPDCTKSLDPPIQIVRLDEDTFVLRQNRCIHYEAPFLYLLFGRDKALLQDTGATAAAALFPVRETVETLVHERMRERGQERIDLLVTHSHAHSDHVAGDPQFAGRPNTVVAGVRLSDVKRFFGIRDWPRETVTCDLGGRALTVIPIPGHERTHVALYDPRTGVLLTGDSLYPGRLYVEDWAAYRESVSRLAAFVREHEVEHVLGTHIEMSETPGVDYPVGTVYQPEEHGLRLEPRHLFELEKALGAIGETPARKVLDDFVIVPLRR